MRIHCKYDVLEPWRKLKPHPKNRNKHTTEQIERLAKLIEYQGCRAPIVVSKLSGCIVKGHGTLMAMQQILKAENEVQVPVVYQNFENEEQEYAFLQSDNAIAAWAELDLAGINADIGELGPDFDIDLLGIEGFEIDVADKNEEDPDATPPVPVVSHVKRGELFLLGKHRLLCGDSTNPGDVRLVMNGEKADMVFTDPPYNIGLEYHSYDDRKSGTDFDEILRSVFAQCHELLVEKGHCLFTMGHKWMFQTKSIVESIGFEFRHLGIWHNPQRKAGGNPGMWPISYEAVLDFTKNGFRKLNNGNSVGHMDVWIETPTHETEHPAQKPVKLWAYLLELCTDSGEKVYDPFSGSGTTLIACEKTNRKCFGMEIDPIYCDVILDRWAKFTGKDPIREDGTPWSKIKAEGDL